MIKGVVLGVVVVVLLAGGQALAGDKGKMVAMLADYDDIKERAAKIMATRAEGYSSDTKTIASIVEDCADLLSAAVTMDGRLMKADYTFYLKSAEGPLLHHLIGASFAIQGMLHEELDYATFKKKESLGAAAKFQDTLKLIDAMIQKNRKR